MTFSKSIAAIIFSIALLLAISANGYGEWSLDEENIKIIVLTRVDRPAEPHEIDHGVYGYWIDTATWSTVLDFETGSGPVSPYTWNDVTWTPNGI